MSYARLGVDHSAVYVFDHYQGYVCCCFCTIAQEEHDEEEMRLRSLGEVERHFLEHVRRGEHVPVGMIDNIKNDPDCSLNQVR